MKEDFIHYNKSETEIILIYHIYLIQSWNHGGQFGNGEEDGQWV